MTMSRFGDLYKAMEILRKEALSLNDELHKVFTSSLIVVPKKNVGYNQQDS